MKVGRNGVGLFVDPIYTTHIYIYIVDQAGYFEVCVYIYIIYTYP